MEMSGYEVCIFPIDGNLEKQFSCSTFIVMLSLEFSTPTKNWNFMSIANIYLNRHWPNRLCLVNAKSLTTKRLLAYYKKYQQMRHKYSHDTYAYTQRDIEYNREFGTNVSKQINDYLDEIRMILSKRENQLI